MPGHQTRLRIFQSVCTCCYPVALETDGGVCVAAEGLTVGEARCSVISFDRVTSTVSFHLKEMKNAGLISM